MEIINHVWIVLCCGHVMSETKTIHSKTKTTFNKSYNMLGIKELFIDLGLRKNRNYKNIVTFSIFKQQKTSQF